MERNDTYYWEFNEGGFNLLDPAGGILFFHSRHEMLSSVPESALLIEVTDDNWSELYEEGAFDGHH